MSTTTEDGPADPGIEQAFAHHPIASLVVDRQSTIVAANRSADALFGRNDEATTLLGCSLGEAIGVDEQTLMHDIVVAASVGFIVLNLDRSIGRASARVRFSVTSLGNRPRRIDRFLLSVAPEAPACPEFIELTLSVRDEQARLARKHAAVQRALHKQLEQRHARINAFSAMAAHDLKAPLRNLSSVLEILEEDHREEITGDGPLLMSHATNSVNTMQALIDGLLAYAKTEGVGANLERVTLREALDSVRKNLSVTLEQTNARIVLAGPIDTVQADPLLFGQLFGNLIGNAVKYRSPDRALEVQVSSVQHSDSVSEIHIQDNGMGFDNAYNSRILEPFKRLHAGSGIEGSGLGLATCKTICDLHGWTLACHGQEGVGATFIIGIGDPAVHRLAA